MAKRERICITGGSGFIGTNLIKRLKGMNYELLNISLDDPKMEVDTIKVDLNTSDFKFLDDYKIDYMIHLAALSNHQMCNDPGKTFDINVNSTFKLLNNLVDRGIKKIIFMSSIVVYDNNVPVPIRETAKLNIFHNNYSFSKGLDEMICEYFRRLYDLPIMVFRLSNIYGPYQGWMNYPNLMPQVISQALKSGEIKIWNKNPVRDWIFVEDVVSALIKALNASSNTVLNLGTGKGTSVEEIVGIVSNITGVKVKCLNKKTTGPQRIVCNIERIKKNLNWEPKVDINEGIERTIKYYKEIF